MRAARLRVARLRALLLCSGPRSERLSGAGLPPGLHLEAWSYAQRVVGDGLLDGYGAVRRCTLEGRACMGYDLSMVERAVREGRGGEGSVHCD